MRKILIMSMALFLIGCSHQTQAMIETTVSETATAADQASKEIEEFDMLEAMGEITYDEESGDIIEVQENEEETQNKIMEILRIEVKTGKLADEEIDDTVRELCDFLDEGKQNEFISELHSLINVPPTPETKTYNTKPQPEPTQAPAVTQQTQPEVQPTEPVPQPTQPEVTAPQPTPQETVAPGTTVKDANGNEVHRLKLDDYSSLTPEQIDAINNSSWN